MTTKPIPVCGEHHVQKEWRQTTFEYSDEGITVRVPNVYAWVCPESEREVHAGYGRRTHHNDTRIDNACRARSRTPPCADRVHRFSRCAIVWDLAAPYSHVNPVEVEAGRPPEQVVRQHLYVEPDDDVLPAQGYNVVLGNLLRDSWEAIWEHAERKGLGESGRGFYSGD